MDSTAGRRPRPVARAALLVRLLLLLGAVMATVAVVLGDRVLGDSVAPTADSARAAPTVVPVVVVLYVTVAALVLVLLSFLTSGHDWARHSLAVAFALLGVWMTALVVAGPVVTLVVLGLVWVALDVVLLVLLYRPGMGALVEPAPRP
jgi:hypothetical protein